MFSNLYKCTRQDKKIHATATAHTRPNTHTNQYENPISDSKQAPNMNQIKEVKKKEEKKHQTYVPIDLNCPHDIPTETHNSCLGNHLSIFIIDFTPRFSNATNKSGSKVKKEMEKKKRIKNRPQRKKRSLMTCCWAEYRRHYKYTNIYFLAFTFSPMEFIFSFQCVI